MDQVYRLQSTLISMLTFLGIAFLLSGIFNNSYGQNNYTFQQSSEIYQPLTGGTVIATATTDSAGGVATSLNSFVSPLPIGSIPFTFFYDNSPYNSVFVSANGFLSFALTPSAGNTNPINNTSANYAGAISAFGRDLIGNFRRFNSLDPDTIASIRYGVTGTSPNRMFVVEWVNFRPTGTTPTGLGPNMSFQIRLLECSNSIEIAYGNFTGGTWPNGTAQIGLRFSNTSQFFNRMLPSGQPWTATTRGTANNSVCNYTNTMLPASGQVFRFVPKPVMGLGVADLTSTNARLQWNGMSGLTGINYRVEWGPAGFVQGSGTSVVTPDTFLLISGLNAGASYDYYVRRECGGAAGSTEYAGPKTFTAGQPAEACPDAILLPVYADSASALPVLVTSGESQNGPNAICSDLANGNRPDDDRWYKFVAPSNGKKLVVRTSAGTNPDWVMELWAGCPGTGQVAYKCSDDISTSNPMPGFYLCQNEYVGGQTYFIRAWTYTFGAAGNMNLFIHEALECPIPPANDSCVFAAMIPINPVLTYPSNKLTFTTSYATHSGIGQTFGQAPTCDPSLQLKDVWIGFNTGTTGDLKITFDLVTATALKAQLLFECGGFQIQCFNNAVGTFTLTGLNPLANYVLRVWSPPGQEGRFTVQAEDACDDATGVISGSQVIAPLTTGQIRFDFTGLPPWTATFTDGSVNTTFTTSNTPHFQNVSPAVTSFYNLVQLNSTICRGKSMSGVASITIGSPLPVDWLEFKGKYIDKSVHLNWSTASEKNADRFEVERSTDGNDFVRIGSVPASGNSTVVNHYAFIDNDASSGSNYYRLRQVDYDGTEDFSNTILVEVKQKIGKAYPNPVTQGMIYFDREEIKDRPLVFQLFDLSGKLVMDTRLAASGNSKLALNIDEAIPSGAYLLTVSDGEEVLSRDKLIIHR